MMSVSTLKAWRCRRGAGSWSSPRTSWTTSSGTCGRTSRPGARPSSSHGPVSGLVLIPTLRRQCAASQQLSAARAANPTLLQQHAFVQLVLLNIGLCLFILLFVYKIYNTWINSLAELCQGSLTLTNNNNGGRMQVVYLWS